MSVAQLPVGMAAKEVHVLACHCAGNKIGAKDDHVWIVGCGQDRVPSSRPRDEARLPRSTVARRPCSWGAKPAPRPIATTNDPIVIRAVAGSRIERAEPDVRRFVATVAWHRVVAGHHERLLPRRAEMDPAV